MRTDQPPLPPLPRGAVYTPAMGTVGAAMYTFTADQMRAYAEEAYKQGYDKGWDEAQATHDGP